MSQQFFLQREFAHLTFCSLRSLSIVSFSLSLIQNTEKGNAFCSGGNGDWSSPPCGCLHGEFASLVGCRLGDRSRRLSRCQDRGP